MPRGDLVVGVESSNIPRDTRDRKMLDSYPDEIADGFVKFAREEKLDFWR
jgi:hypothetical protein